MTARKLDAKDGVSLSAQRKSEVTVAGSCPRRGTIRMGPIPTSGFAGERWLSMRDMPTRSRIDAVLAASVAVGRCRSYLARKRAECSSVPPVAADAPKWRGRWISGSVPPSAGGQ